MAWTWPTIWTSPVRPACALQDSSGYLNIASRAPIQDDSIARIYSMSKPITCAAALVCYEMGHFEMEQPVEMYLPEFKGVQVRRPACMGRLLCKIRHQHIAINVP